MVSLSDGAMSVEDADNYYRQHYSTMGEYYAPDETPTIGQTLGKGAQALGLQGEITAEQFAALLRGIDPVSGTLLRTAPSHGSEQRAGWDVTLSPPKSLSLQALVAGDARLIEAARQAAIYAIEQAEACALGRRHGGKEWVQTANIVAVMFEHHDARESITGKHGPMPQLHHHTFITNLTQMPDGQWRGLDPKEIYKARRFIDAIYMNDLANRIQNIGYGIERHSDGTFELAGYTREQIEAFSERRQDIKQLMAQNGITDARSAAARKMGALGRVSKHQHDPQLLKAEREALAAEYGIRLDHHPRHAVERSISPQIQAKESLEFAIHHTTSRQAAVDHREIITAALKHRVGATDLDQVRAQIATQQQAGTLIAGEQSHKRPLGCYTTRDMIRLEMENLTLVRDRMNHGRPITGIAIRSAMDGALSSTGTQEVRQWAICKGLLPDQTDAAVLTLTTPRWASAIEGLAGSTKTTTVGAIKEFAENHGWSVRGFGQTSGSRNELQDAGIDALTIAKALTSPLPPKTGRELWIVDESSLLATRDANRLLKLALERGIERMVFTGDQHQHLAIAAGSPVQQFLADNMLVTRLTTIRRQLDPELRRVVELAASERIPEAVDLLVEQNRVTAIPDMAKRYERIAADYLDAYEARQRALVISPANDERRALNQAIRQTLIAHRYVASLGQEHQVLIPRDMTPAQLRHAQAYHQDDVLYFRRGSKRQGIPKGSYLTVAEVKDGTLTLRADNGRRFDFDPKSLKGIQAYTAEARTIAVGDRLQWREPDNQRRIANGEYATITKLDQRNIEVRLDKGRKLSMPLADARKVDLGYASTSHAAQGATVDRVITNIDSGRSPELVNQRQAYVSWSRARIDLRIYTDDIERMRRAVARTQEKELALDIIERQQRRASTAMRI